MPKDTVFTMETVPLKFGWGATQEVGHDAAALGMRRCLVVTDGRLRRLGLAELVANRVRETGVAVEVYDGVRCEPDDASLRDAAAFAQAGEFDGYVGLGGGSALDTAKAVNLLCTHGGALEDYLNVPVGAGRPVPGPLRPLIAIPTTAGTGSETTAVVVLDVLRARVKTGISHRYLRPALALCDPENTLTVPPLVTALTGLDVLCHAVESYVMRPYESREAPASPAERKPYNGANPVSDLWCEGAIARAIEYLERAVTDGGDREARYNMLLASTMAGFGFGNAGVHLPHAMGYPIASLVREYLPPDYESDHALVPHGMSVVLGSPAAFRFTATVAPERHLRAAELMGVEVENAAPDSGGELIAQRLLEFMRKLGLPNGLSGVGYTEADIPALVAGTVKQQRLLVLSPKPADEQDLMTIFRGALRYW